MKFEKFVTKFTRAVDESEKRNQGLHNSDIIDLIWKKIMIPELSQYVTALKVQFQRQPRDYQDILQDIARKVPSLQVPNFKKASKVGAQDRIQTKGCPYKGEYMTIMASCILASTLSTSGLINLSNLIGMKSAVVDIKARIRTARTRNTKIRNASKHSSRQQYLKSSPIS